MNTTEDLIVEGNVTDDPNLLTDFDLHFIFKKIVHIRILWKWNYISTIFTTI